MLCLHNGTWEDTEQFKCHNIVTSNHIIELIIINFFLYIDFYDGLLAPHFCSFNLENRKKLDVTLNGYKCTKESIEAFILALAIELQRRYDEGKKGYSIELEEVFEKLRTEYLQPIQNVYISSNVQVLKLRCTL